ncbi:MAG: transcriptional regulator [Candidatus Freyarchaeota archaeon]
MASKDQALGALVLVICVVGVVVYGWLVFFTVWSQLVLQLTGFVAISGVLGIGAWVGWVMATTPPPKPKEELETEETEVRD